MQHNYVSGSEVDILKQMFLLIRNFIAMLVKKTLILHKHAKLYNTCGMLYAHRSTHRAAFIPRAGNTLGDSPKII